MSGLVNVDIGSIISGAGSAIKDIANALRGTNPELAMKLMEVQAQMDNAQSEINKVEAASTSLFVSGWRPFVGWVCAVAFTLLTIIYPIVFWVASWFGKTVPLPPIDGNTIFGMLGALLGIGGFRTYEKMKGVTK